MDTTRLYDTLFSLFGRQAPWKDARHLQTLIWMLVGLIQSQKINLPAWTPFVISRARFAQSTVRRFSRWLRNSRIEVYALWTPIIRMALRQWEQHTIYLALDTTILWEEFCQIRLSVIYRGRALPLFWKTIAQQSASVAFDAYRDLLERAATVLPPHAEVILLADRGFASTQLLAYLTDTLHWHYRIRFKENFFIKRPGRPPVKARRLRPSKGKALFLRSVRFTKANYGPVHLAIAWAFDAREAWYIVSDQPTDQKVFTEYGLRFDIEEHILDDKSSGFQLESSLFRETEVLDRLAFVLAAATLFLVSQGVEVVEHGKRRWVDAHWFRGSSYLKIGWKWVFLALARGEALSATLALPPLPDPEPAKASRIQALQKQKKRLVAAKYIFFT